MNVRSVRLTYWITTALFCGTMGLSAVLYLTNAGFQEKFAHLGFPSYFRIELALFKFAGVLALLLPVRLPMKEWSYAGFFITLFSASLAHIESGDGVTKAMNPVLTAALLVASYLSYYKLNRGQSQSRNR